MAANPPPNATPPPPSGVGAASPHQIGRAFVKQYYKTLLTSPSQLDRFYQVDSTVSRGMEPAAPATPSPFSLTSSAANGSALSPGERVRKAFFDWAGAGTGAVDVRAHTASGLRIDFERGAIDAQESINGGILVVVTGHMFLPGSSKEDAFVHTFFLNNAALPGRKKQFLVKNDIMRFLEPAEAGAKVEEFEAVLEESAAAANPPPAMVVEPRNPVTLVPEPTLVSPPAMEPIPLVIPVEYEPSADEEKVEEEGAVEEPTVMSQPPISEVDPAAEEEKADIAELSSGASESSPAVTPAAPDGKKGKRHRKKKGGKSRSRSNSPRKEDAAEDDSPGKAKTPGSWASLVASSAGPVSNAEGDGKSARARRGSPKGSRGGRAETSSSSNDGNQVVSAKAPPQCQPEKEPTSAAAAAAAAAAIAPVTATTPSQPLQSQRSPEATLFIRNIPDKTTEPQIRALFESQGAATGNKILGITLNPNRGFCFVDFDGPAAVAAIVNESTSSLIKDPRTGRKVESSFMVHGRVLDVEKKVKSDRHKANSGRRYNRSHSPKDGGGRYRGSRGGGGGGMRRSPPRGGGGAH